MQVSLSHPSLIRRTLDIANKSLKKEITFLIKQAAIFDTELNIAKQPLKTARAYIQRHYATPTLQTAKMLAERAVCRFEADKKIKAERIQTIRNADSIDAVCQAMKPKPKVETLIKRLENYIAEKKPIQEGWRKWWGRVTDWFSILGKKIGIAQTALDKLTVLQNANTLDSGVTGSEDKETPIDLEAILAPARQDNAKSLHWYQRTCFFNINNKSQLQGILNGEVGRGDRPRNTQ